MKLISIENNIYNISEKDYTELCDSRKTESEINEILEYIIKIYKPKMYLQNMFNFS